MAAGGMGINVEVTGLTEVLARLQALVATAPMKVAEAARMAAEDAKATGDALTPVDTGYMKSRNAVRMGLGIVSYAEFYNDCSYAPFVCLGHHTRSGSWVAPQDWMTPALRAGELALRRRLSEIVLV